MKTAESRETEKAGTSLPIGEKQTLIVCQRTEHGVYLTAQAGAGREENCAERVLLPKRYVRRDLKNGDALEVFLYLDSEDRPVATTEEPKLTLHRVGRLTVRQTTRLGAFLDWGLPKDLFLPFANQTKRVRAGEDVLVAPILDKSGRLAATMNVYEWLATDAPYHAGDWVEGTVYEKSGNFGVFVAVDDRYSALLPKKELTREIVIGEVLRVRVTAVQPDGRLALSLRDKAWLQMDADAETILKRLDADGKLPFTDKAEPEVIRAALGMSKSQFKRAVGRLLKEEKIAIGESEIVRR